VLQQLKIWWHVQVFLNWIGFNTSEYRVKNVTYLIVSLLSPSSNLPFLLIFSSPVSFLLVLSSSLPPLPSSPFLPFPYPFLLLPFCSFLSVPPSFLSFLPVQLSFLPVTSLFSLPQHFLFSFFFPSFFPYLTSFLPSSPHHSLPFFLFLSPPIYLFLFHISVLLLLLLLRPSAHPVFLLCLLYPLLSYFPFSFLSLFHFL
jgi:hypothetical protein